MWLLVNMFASEIFNQTTVTGTPTFAFAAMNETWGAQIWSHTGQRNVWPRYDGQMTQQKGPNGSSLNSQGKKTDFQNKNCYCCNVYKVSRPATPFCCWGKPFKSRPFAAGNHHSVGHRPSFWVFIQTSWGKPRSCGVFHGATEKTWKDGILGSPSPESSRIFIFFRFHFGSEKMIILILNKLSRQETPNSVGGSERIM